MKTTFLATVEAINPTATSYKVGRKAVRLGVRPADIGSNHFTIAPHFTHEDTRELAALFGEHDTVRVTVETGPEPDNTSGFRISWEPTVYAHVCGSEHGKEFLIRASRFQDVLILGSIANDDALRAENDRLRDALGSMVPDCGVADCENCGHDAADARNGRPHEPTCQNLRGSAYECVSEALNLLKSPERAGGIGAARTCIAAAKARLDADRTAKPLTRIVHHPPSGACVGPGMPLHSPEYEGADGERVPLDARREPEPIDAPRRRLNRAVLAASLELEKHGMRDLSRELVEADWQANHADNLCDLCGRRSNDVGALTEGLVACKPCRDMHTAILAEEYALPGDLHAGSAQECLRELWLAWIRRPR